MVVVQVQTESDNCTFALREGWWKDIGGCTFAFAGSGRAHGVAYSFLQYKIQLQVSTTVLPRSSAKQVGGTQRDIHVYMGHQVPSSGHTLFI